MRDVSNNKYNNGGRFSKPLDMKNLNFSKKEEDRCKEVEEEEEEDGSLDRLLLVQSDLSSLIHQVTAISLLMICLFLEKMISKTRIASCSMYFTTLMKILLNLCFICLLQVLIVLAFVFFWLLRKCGGYICVFEYFASNWKKNLLSAFHIIDCTVL